MKVACALLIQKNKILLAKRPAHKSHPNQWEFPGGKLENNETAKKALVRELKEELLLEISSIELESLGEVKVDNIELLSFVIQNPGPLAPKSIGLWLGWSSQK